MCSADGTTALITLGLAAGRNAAVAAYPLVAPCYGCTGGWGSCDGWCSRTCSSECPQLSQFHALGCRPDARLTLADVPAVLAAAARYPWLGWDPAAWQAWADLVGRARALLDEQCAALAQAEQALGYG